MPSSATFKSLAVAILSFCVCLDAWADDAKVRLELFHQTGCKECELIKRIVMPGIEERFKGHYDLKLFDIGVKENFLRLAEYQESLKISSNEAVTMIVQGKVALCGYAEISSKLQDSIEDALAEPQAETATPLKDIQPPQSTSILAKRSEKMTLIAVVAAGLLDGLNPCAFSTLVFFMSLLAVSKVRDGRLLAVGACYCLASFLTYTLLGFGLFKFIKALTAFHLVQGVFNYSMAALLLVLAALSFRDAFRFRKSGDAATISLQLPRRFKLMIHAVMRRGLGYRLLIPGAFLIGVAVTFLESVCTGQVYLPTLALLAKECPETVKWTSLILLYNAMFTIPLLFVFAVAYFGIKTSRLLAWSRGDVVPAKVLLGLLFLALAALILLM